MSPTSPCDLVAIAPDGETTRIEVKTKRYQGGKVYVPAADGMTMRRHVCDVVAAVTPFRQVLYSPPMRDWVAEEEQYEEQRSHEHRTEPEFEVVR